MRAKLLPLIAFLLVGFALVYRQYQPVSKDASKVPFTIAKGQGLDRIGQNLQSAGLIRSIPAFKFEIMRQGLSKKVQAGDYSLSPSMPLNLIVSSLTKGRSDITLKILEGWRKEEIALEAQNILGSSFDPILFLTLTATLEGQLYPDTYQLSKTTTAQSLVVLLTTNFTKKTSTLTASPTSLNSALILASLIEREALTDSERPIIAGILQNRLNAGWPLQVDAAIQYQKANQLCGKKLTCDWWPANITRDDLQKPSPYNTYLNQGLPPTPISNPSVVSIAAALNPTPSDYWFYLHDPTGQIHYARNLQEHNTNIAKYLKR